MLSGIPIRPADPGRDGVLCSGSIVYDTLIWPCDDTPWGTTTFVDSIEFQVGGNGANTSIALARLDVPVKLVGCVGKDEQARFVLKQLKAAGVDVTHVGSIHAPTAATAAMIDTAGQRRFLHRLGASAKALSQPVEFDAALVAGVSHYHLASLFVLPAFRPHAPESLRRAREAGLTTSLDTNWDPLNRWIEDIRPCLPHLDILFANEDEARMLTGSADPIKAGTTLLNEGVRMVVLKLGRQGCALFGADLEHHSPAFEVNVKDTTGAGDCFVAGFLAAALAGDGLIETARFANAVAAQSVQQVGAVSGMEGIRREDLTRLAGPR
jgi:sugar/nucleoside kinase (ribokinase family)